MSEIKTPQEVAEKIMQAIVALGEEGKRSEGLIKAKAESAAEYDKTIAIAITELKAKGEPVSIIDKLSKGRCSDILIKKILSEEMLKAHYSKLERIEAQLNGLQSINRFLSSTSKSEFI